MSLVHLLKRTAAVIRQNRVKIFDLGFVLVALAVATLFFAEFEIFEHEGSMNLQQETLALNEVMALATLTTLAALAYTWRRANEHRRENARRLKAEREVLNLAMHDPLTGLPNRRQFDDSLRQALRTPPAAPEAHAVLMLDLNGFKKINDMHGHPVGDEALIQAGARLLRSVRRGDLVARLGGDEFAILARNVSGPEEATNIARRIIEAFAEPVQAGGGRHILGTGIGVALSPMDGAEPDEILRKADVALYRAKAERTSALRFFEAEMDARLKERDLLEKALREAVEADTLEVRFQPAIEAGSGSIVGFEAFGRWIHPEFGELRPDRFLPIAEEAGLLPQVTEQLLRKACRAAAAWPAAVRLSFNLAGAQLRDPTLGLRLLSILNEMGVAPGRLDLEVDEGALIRDADTAQALLGPLRAAGVSIVADHFGTGYSDLQNLHRLQLDRVKIDRSFVGAMTRDEHAQAMVKALIALGRGLDLEIIADGVATEEQRAALASQGCDRMQGRFYSELVPAERALALVGPPRGRRRAG